MATRRYTGTAPRIAQVQSYLFGGTWEATDLITATIGLVTVSFTAGSTSITTIIDAIVTAWNLLEQQSYPQFRQLTASRSSNSLILTGMVTGRPFVCTLATADAGGAADDQRIEGGTTPTTGTEDTAASSPNHWSIADNWTDDTVPASADIVILENSAIDILYGLSQSAVDLTRLIIRQSYSGKLGLPKRNSANYEEYLPDYLAIGLETGEAGLEIGSGEGSGSGRLKIAVNADAFNGLILNSGSPAEGGIPSILLRGGDGASLTVAKGSVGVAIFAGETANLDGGLNLSYLTNVATDASVRCGTGVTLGAIAKNGGRLEINSSCGEFIQGDGESTVQAGSPTQLTIRGGRVNWNSITTLAGNTIIGDGAILDFNLDPRAKTVTNPFEVFGRGRVIDDYKVVNADGAMVIDLNEVGRDYPLNVGSNIRITRTLLGSSAAAFLIKYSANVGNNSDTSLVLTHGLNTRDVLVEVYRSTDPWDTVLCDVDRTDANNVTLTFGVAPGTSEFRVVILG